MDSYKKLANIAGWTVFGIATIVYFFSVERTGSLWDCGEFITGAHKLQVVHPPGAALFLLVGRMFAMVADLFSDNPENIAFAVNMLSGICSAFAATFICWVTIMLGKLAIIGREEEPSSAQAIALAGAGLIAGLATAFSTSIWFSAVEGEVYAMSTFFSALTLWAAVKWYTLPDEPSTDRWLVFAIYAAGLSIGVHLLSILTFPALALFYYFKKYENHTLVGMAGAAAIGVVAIVALQTLVITGIPHLWSGFELMMVNGLGLPFHSGVFPTVLLIIALLTIPLLYLNGKIKSHIPFYVAAAILGLTMAYYITFGNSDSDIISLAVKLLILGGVVAGTTYALDNYKYVAQLVLVSGVLVVISFSTIGVVVIRANANTPINMNNPNDPLRLLPYLNREQYGERALFNGPNFDAKAEDFDTDREDRYGRLSSKDEYVVTDRKISQTYNGRKMLIPRMQDRTQSRPALYRRWMANMGSTGSPSQMDNLKFMFKYQFGWMYWRYFMWNFAGRQNGDQGFYSWDKTDGNWATGIKPLDSAMLYNQSSLPSRIANNMARNKYFLIPFLFGLLGLFFHFSKNRQDATGLFAFFIITGIGIIIYSNQPPNEPRERDYVLIGSFFTFCIWMGMGALALFEVFKDQVKLDGKMAAPLAIGLVMIAPLLMGFQNFDDHSRKDHSGARDYASNFLKSCDDNAIIFTYGDNDTYPLWYAQEIEGIRTDVRVVNLSLIAVDWYIEQLRRTVNKSPAIKMSIPMDQLRGYRRNQLFVIPPGGNRNYRTSLSNALKIVGEDNPQATRGQLESYMPASKLTIPVNQVKAREMVSPEDYDKILPQINFDIDDIYRDENVQRRQQGREPRTVDQLLKGDIAVLDIINSNFQDRPIYFAVTCRPQSLLGLDDYLQLEGLGLKLVPLKNRDPNYRYAGMMGKGKINADKTLKVMTEEFRWGGFDKKKLFVDRSYGPAIQSQKAAMVRAAETFIDRGENDKAIQMADQFFEAFPFMNFRYEFQALQMLEVYVKAEAYDKAKPQIELMAGETEEYLQFFDTIDPDVRDSRDGFGREYQFYSQSAIGQLVNFAMRMNDKELEDKLKTMFQPYQTVPTRD
ncbi:MAG: DUF2723 domain-containing protein [Bacteroidota bacterium]